MNKNLLIAAILLAGVRPIPADPAETAKHLDAAWFRAALTSETAHWRAAALRPNGFFAVSLDRQWRPVGNPNGTLVSQCRQIFVMGEGYGLTHDPAYLDAMRKGADFLLEHFLDKEKGLFFYGVNPEGAVIDQSKDSYGLAFTIFGSSARRAYYARQTIRRRRARDLGANEGAPAGTIRFLPAEDGSRLYQNDERELAERDDASV